MIVDLLYQALHAKHGVVVETSNPDLLRQKLYAERKKDPDLACISILKSRTHPESQLLLIKKGASDGNEG